MKEKSRESIKEILAPFFENPDRVAFRDILRGCLGEFDHIDFKEKWIEIPDLAKHILAMANTCGGVIIFGVREEDSCFSPVGLSENRDKTKVKDSLDKYLPSTLDYDIHDFSYVEAEWGPLIGKSFQVVKVHDVPDKIPFLSNSDSSNIYKNRIYYRSKTNTEEANQQQIDDIITRRIGSLHHITSETKFKQDLSQLNQLYEQLSPVTMGVNLLALKKMLQRQNPNYPKESFEDFINRMIELKKVIIEGAVTERKAIDN